MRNSVLFAAALLAAPALAQEVKVDADLPEFQKTAGLELAGDLNAVGSDTMINLMTLWGERFSKYHPGVRVQVEGKGSSTAPPALIEGTAQLGPMSREMKDKEVDAFVEKHGYEPTRIKTCLDALAVFVHKDNPIQGLTLEEVDAIFGKSRKLGYETDIVNWKQVSGQGRWANASISLYGRNSASGTYGFFKKNALGKGDFKNTVKEQPGSAAVVQAIANDPFAIGYSGIGYLTSGVRAVPLSADGDDGYFNATLGNVATGDYPLGRFLNLYVNLSPNSQLDPLRREFLSFILSEEGQEVVVKSGYLPMPAVVVEEERKALGLVQP